MSVLVDGSAESRCYPQSLPEWSSATDPCWRNPVSRVSHSVVPALRCSAPWRGLSVRSVRFTFFDVGGKRSGESRGSCGDGRRGWFIESTPRRAMSRARSTAADGEPGADRVRSTRALNIAAIDLIYAAIIAIRTGAQVWRSGRRRAAHSLHIMSEL